MWSTGFRSAAPSASKLFQTTYSFFHTVAFHMLPPSFLLLKTLPTVFFLTHQHLFQERLQYEECAIQHDQ